MPFYDHVDQQRHLLSHVIVTVPKIMDEEAGGTVFDRLAYKTVYKFREVGLDMNACKEIDHSFLQDNGLKLRMEVGVRMRNDRIHGFDVEVEVVHVGNLPGLVITVIGSMPLKPVVIPIDVQVLIFGSSKNVVGICCPASTVIYCGRQGGGCISSKHFTSSEHHVTLDDRRERDIYKHCHHMDVIAFKRAGGLIYDVVEVWGGAEFHSRDVTFAPEFSKKRCVVPATPIYFFIGINYVATKVQVASLSVMKDVSDAMHCPARSFSCHRNDSGSIAQLHTVRSDIGDFVFAKSSTHLFKPSEECYHRILDFSFKMFQYTAKSIKDSGSLSDVLAEEFEVIPSDEVMDPAKMMWQMSKFADGATELMRPSVVRFFEQNRFWSFFANVLGMFLLERDGRFEIPWLIFDKIGVDEESVDRTMRIYVQTSGSRWFTGTNPECVSMEYDDGDSRQKHFLQIRRVVKQVRPNLSYLEIEEDITFTERQVLARIQKRSTAIKFFHCKDIFMSLRIFTDLTQTVVCDKKLAMKTIAINGSSKNFTKSETLAKHTFRDAMDPELTEASVKRTELLWRSGQPKWEAIDFETARFNRSRLLSAVDIISPGAGCNDLNDYRLPAVLDSLIDGFGAAGGELFEEYGGSMHRFIVRQVRDMPWEDSFRNEIDNGVCGATSINGEVCTCRITKDSIIDIFFQKVTKAPRFALLEGPAGTGKTYILSRLLYKLISAYEACCRSSYWIDEKWSVEWIKETVLSPKFFVLSTTNDNVEITKEYICEAGVQSQTMIHLVSRKQNLQQVGKTRVRKVYVPTVADEQMSYKLLTRYIEKYQVIFSTVDVACGYLSRLRLLQNGYIFLDEAAQVSIVNGMYLMMYCDCMVLFGDSYQTEPYLGVEDSVVKAYMVDVSVMELIVKCLEAQGSDLQSRYCVRTYFNFRSTESQCRFISQTCYPDKHPLRSVVVENRQQTTRKMLPKRYRV